MRGKLTLLIFLFAALAGWAQTGAEFRAQIDIDHNGRPVADRTNAVVWLTPLDRPAAMPAAGEHHYTLTQHNKRFEPHLLVIPVGSVVDFPNRDPFFHNVFSLYKGKKFDLGLYESGSSRSVRFDRPGVSYVFCNIHPQMSASVLALATPYYGISSKSGEVRIPDLPPGRYRLEVWYEGATQDQLDSLTREVVVSTAPNTVALHLHQVNEGTIPHKNKYGKDYDTPADYIPH